MAFIRAHSRDPFNRKWFLINSTDSINTTAGSVNQSEIRLSQEIDRVGPRALEEKCRRGRLTKLAGKLMPKSDSACATQLAVGGGGGGDNSVVDLLAPPNRILKKLIQVWVA